MRNPSNRRFAGGKVGLRALMVAGLVAAFAMPLPAGAQTAGAPAAAQAEEPLLTIKAGDRTTGFDRSMLERLPQRQAMFDTAWDMGGTWQGPLLRDVLAAGGLGEAAKVRLTAVDDYAIDLGKDRIEAGEPILAMRLNGEPLRIETKGPLMLVWPKEARQVRDGSAPSANWIWCVVAMQKAD